MSFSPGMVKEESLLRRIQNEKTQRHEDMKNQRDENTSFRATLMAEGSGADC